MEENFRDRMRKFHSLISFQDAVGRVKATKWATPPEDEISVIDSHGLVSSHSVLSCIDVPGVPRSLVDGFAVDSSSLRGTSASDRCRLRIAGVAAAGKPFKGPLEKMECVEIYTGGILPAGTDAVIMAEDAHVLNGYIEVSSEIAPGNNVSRVGEEMKCGSPILSSGEEINAFHVAAMIQAGVRSVKVFRPLNVRIIPTGDELLPDSEDPVENTTSRAMESLLFKPYSRVTAVDPVKDSAQIIASRISQLLHDSDMIILTGGSSLGMFDQVPEALSSMKADVIFGGVRTRPGRTTSLYRLRGKPILSVSGFPYAASILSDVFLEVYLQTVMNLHTYRHALKLTAGSDIVSRSGYTNFIPGVIKNEGNNSAVMPVVTRGSRLSTLMLSHGLITVPENVEGYSVGETIDFRMW